jgi:AcrR family transcriptional regulator
MMELDLFRSRRFLYGSIAATVGGFALFGLLFVLPQYLQAVRGNDAFATGLRLLPMMAGLIVAARDSQRVVATLGNKVPVVTGLLVTAAGLGWGATTGTGTGYAEVAGWLAVIGFGFGLALTAAMDAVLSALPPDRAGAGTGLSQTLRQLGGALGIAILGSVLAGTYQSRLRRARRRRPGTRSPGPWPSPPGWATRPCSPRAAGRTWTQCRRCCWSARPSPSPGPPSARSSCPDRRRSSLPRKNRHMKSPGLRERKKQKTRWAIQEHALRLFEEQGYDKTTVDQIAEAAEISPSTFFRYFKTKEDVVLEDEYDPLMEKLFIAPKDLALIPALRHALRQALSKMVGLEREKMMQRADLMMSVPALRKRLVDNLIGTTALLASAAAKRTGLPATDFRLRTFAGACIGVMLAALFQWMDSDRTGDVAELIDRALAELEQGFD